MELKESINLLDRATTKIGCRKRRVYVEYVRLDEVLSLIDRYLESKEQGK